ncbi:hypothetical protein B0H13DRAFT_1935233, partial [Mycena leptocephala]
MDSEVLVADDRPRNKQLPSRGTLFESRPDAINFYSTRWILANFTLFFLPLITYLGTLVLLCSVPARLDIFGHQSPLELVYVLAYFSACTGSYNMLIVVTQTTTVNEVFGDLISRGFVEADQQDQFYFTHNGRKISWADTVGSFGAGPGSHLFLKVPQVIVSSDDEEGTKPPKLKMKPKPPVKSRGGRISHSHRKQRHDDELPLDLAQASSPPSTLHPMPETPVKKTKDRKTAKSSVAKFTPKTARSVAFALSGYELPSSDDWDSGSETDDWDNKSKNRKPKRKARPLNRVDHKTKGWQRLGSSHTTEVYKTFEQWCNDYNSHDYETADDLVE